MDENNMMENKSTFFFPLRTNVGFFDTPEGYLSIIHRLKYASVLYDQVVFEGGLYRAALLPANAFDMWIPPEQIDYAMIAKQRHDFKPTGGDFAFTFQPDGTDPSEGLTISGAVERRFFCEFHTILHELQSYNLPWLQVASISLTEVGKQQVKAFQSELKVTFDELFPNMGRFLRKKLLTNYCRDVIVTNDIGAIPSMHGMYSPLPEPQEFRSLTPPGFALLQVALPNLTNLQWEEIFETRELSCISEFRQKLLFLENAVQVALENQNIDQLTYHLALAQAFNDELARELAERQPKIGESIGNVLLDLFVNV